MLEKNRRGLVEDLMPNIRLIHLSGIYLSEYYDENSSNLETARGVYTWATFTLLLFQYILLIFHTVTMSYTTEELTAASITCLFFAHSIVKFIYFSVRGKSVCRVLDSWNQENSHPLFVESNNRHKQRALYRMRKLLYMIIAGSLFTYFAWILLTVAEEPYRMTPDPENSNNTVLTRVPKLLVQSWFPWNFESGVGYYIALGYQLYWLFMMIAAENLPDTLFCSTVIYACEQLKHLKEILKPLIEMSSAYDLGLQTKPNILRMRSGDSDMPLIEDEKVPEESYQPVYNLIREFGPVYQRKNIQNVQNSFDALNEKDGNFVAGAIKYWVERHKHVVRFVSDIGTMYGIALLLHMLISTVTLTLLAYQATQITGINVFGLSVIGYLGYSFIQVYAFCIYGNELIEESSSVMEAAYDCRWYDGSEEAKTFVQIVCQQCQKSLSISGAKFFTVSLDLFASVLGAVVTYFMVLVQLN